MSRTGPGRTPAPIARIVEIPTDKSNPNFVLQQRLTAGAGICLSHRLLSQTHHQQDKLMNKTFFSALFIALTVTTSHAQTDSLTYQLDNIVVTGTRSTASIGHLPATVTVVGRETLTETQRTSVLPTLAEYVPGLFVTSRGMLGYGVSDGAAGTISMRGLSSSQGRFMVLIDGHPQYQGIFGHSISDSYQTMLADHVEVMRGPASTLYGSNAMGGVINIVTRKMKSDGVKTDVHLGGGSYGTFQGELTNRIRSGRFYSVVSGQYARTDNNRPRMGFEQYGGYVKLGYDMSQHWSAYADINLTHFNASYPGSVQVPVYDARQWITRGVASVVVSNDYGSTSGAVSAYYNFGRHKINDGYEDGEQPKDYYFRSDDALAGLSVYQNIRLLRGNLTTIGLDYQHIYGKAWNRDRASGETTSVIGHENENEIAGYVDISQDLLSWLTLSAGIRLDHHSQSGTEWIPRGGIVSRVIRNGEIKAMVSKGFRNPSIREMYFWKPANDELRPERIMNYELSWSHKLPSAGLSYGVNLYYMKGSNIIQQQMVDGRPMNVNTGAIENSGAELDLSWRINSSWRVNGNYSLLHMHNPVVGAPESKLWLGANYKSGRWNINGGLQYISGLYTQTGADEVKENVALLNATVSYRACRMMQLWVKGENLLAQKYEINYGYPMPKATFMAGVNLSF